MMRISERGLALITQFEGFRATAYICPAGVPTIGFGSTKSVSRADVTNRRTITREQAYDLLREDVADAERAVNAVKLPAGVRLNQCQFDALVSLVFNTGPAPLKGGVGSALRQGKLTFVPAQMMKWSKARNPRTKQLETLPGLLRRRNAETAMWRAVDPKAAFPLADVPKTMPVKLISEDPVPPEGSEDTSPVEIEAAPDKPLSESGTIRGAVIAGIGGVSVASQAVQPVIEQVQQAQTTFQAVKDFGASGLVIGLVILAVGIGYIVYRRYKDRHFL